MKRLYCHPDNLDAIRTKVGAVPVGPGKFAIADLLIEASEAVQKDKPTGKYRLPCGNVVLPERVNVRTRFIDYGPEDLDWLVFAGIVAEEREPCFFFVDESAFRVGVKVNHMPVISDRRALWGSA